MSMLSDDPIEEENTPPANNREQPPTSEASNDDQSERPNSIPEQLDFTQRKEEFSRILREILRGTPVASVYIDARTGPFFDGGTTIGGSMIGGDAHYDTGSPFTMGDHTKRTFQDIDAIGVDQITTRTLIKIKAVYKPPYPYQQARQILAEKRVLILYGQTNWGKWTSALHLLAEIQDKPLLEINPSIEFKALQTYHWALGRGYVIDTWSPEQATKLTPFALKRLHAQLQQQGSYLVITIDNRVQLQTPTTELYAVAWNEIPAPDKILEKHLNWYVSDGNLRQTAAELVQHQTVTQLLNSHLLPREIDHLGALVSQVVQGSFNLEEAVARFARRVRARVVEWFASHPDVDDRLFMINLAVLNGAVSSMIRDAYERLQAIAIPGKGKQTENVADSLFGRSFNDRISMACAHTVDGYENSEFGLHPVKLILFDDPQFSPAILKYVWENYDGLHATLLKWLYELGSNAPYEVRIRASAAVGELAKYDFGLIRRDVLLSWANHKDGHARLSAAFALGIPVWEGTFAPQVLGLLHHWSTLRDNWRLSWTAAAAYGWLVGLRFPEIALQDIRFIAQRGDVRLLGIVSSSTAALFEMGRHSTNYYLRILTTLQEWGKDNKNKALSSTGLFIFLHIALNSTIEAKEDAGKWPTLLWLAEENDSHNRLIVDLWRDSLNHKPTRKLALSAFREWCISADNDDLLCQALARMMVSIFRQGSLREKERLKFYLQRWSMDPEKKSLCAEKLLTSINQLMTDSFHERGEK